MTHEGLRHGVHVGLYIFYLLILEVLLLNPYSGLAHASKYTILLELLLNVCGISITSRWSNRLSVLIQYQFLVVTHVMLL